MLGGRGSALLFGRMYDRKGVSAIIISSLISAFFAPLVFLFRAPAFAVAGIILWGIGMGAQESILKAAVTTLVPKEKRGTAFGFFNAGFGAFWFLGSWVMGCSTTGHSWPSSSSHCFASSLRFFLLLDEEAHGRTGYVMASTQKKQKNISSHSCAASMSGMQNGFP